MLPIHHVYIARESNEKYLSQKGKAVLQAGGCWTLGMVANAGIIADKIPGVVGGFFYGCSMIATIERASTAVPGIEKRNWKKLGAGMLWNGTLNAIGFATNFNVPLLFPFGFLGGVVLTHCDSFWEGCDKAWNYLRHCKSEYAPLEQEITR